MTDLESRLREVVLAEPPLGFDPDDVATKAAKRQRNRRATAATVVLTLGLVGAAIVALRPSPPPLAPPAATTYLPPVIIVKPPQQPRTPLEQQILDHLKETLPAVLPGSRKILIGSFSSMGGELHPDELTATVSFVDHEGKGHSFNLGLMGKLTVARNMGPVAQACASNGGGRCDKVPRADGSTVVIFGMGAVHYRTDGTAVDLNDVGKVYPDDAPLLGLPAGPGEPPSGEDLTFDDRQLIALVTDPGFAAR